MINCQICEHNPTGERCELFGRVIGMHGCSSGVERKPRNHFEALKAMSMKELAAWFATVPMSYEGTCPNPRPVDCHGWDEERCTNCWLSWLKEEVNNDP